MDFLPEVKMDFIPSDEEVDSDDDDGEIVIEETEEPVVEETEEVEESIDKKVPVAKSIPVAKSKRDDMNVDDIFTMPMQKEKLTKKGLPRKKRPPMTEAHKEKLKFATREGDGFSTIKGKGEKGIKSIRSGRKGIIKETKS